jgi:hypothetical protein
MEDARPAFPDDTIRERNRRRQPVSIRTRSLSGCQG